MANGTKFGKPEEYYIAGAYLSALINGDCSGLEDSEEKDFDAWLEWAQEGRSGVWSYYSEEAENEDGSPNEEERAKAGSHFHLCDVCDLMADCEIVVFHPIID